MPRAALRSRKRGNWHATVKSNARSVYLTDTYGFHFAHAACRSSKERWAVIEIDTAALDEDLLHPDEDMMEQCGRGHDCLPEVWDMRRRTMHYRRLAPRNPHWDVSLAAMGTCAYYGVIPPAAFTRVAFLDWSKQKQIAYAGAYASVSVIGFKVCGAQYRAQQQWLFGDPFDKMAFLGLSFNDVPVPDTFLESPGMQDWKRRWETMMADRKGIEVLNLRRKRNVSTNTNTQLKRA